MNYPTVAHRASSFRRRLATVCAIPIVAALLFPACRNPRHIDVENADSAIATPTPENVTPQGTSSDTNYPGNTEVTGVSLVVNLTDREIQMPDELKAGPVTMQVINRGTKQHSLYVEGPGYHEGLFSDLDPGQASSLGIVLMPGTYTVYSPTDDDAEKGLSRKLIVRDRGPLDQRPGGPEGAGS